MSVSGSVPSAGPVRRLFCKVGFHRIRFRSPDEVADPDDPCRHERRCEICGHLRDGGPIHSYGPNRAVEGHPCGRVRACTRCGHEERSVDHRNRAVFVADLPSSKRPRTPSWQRPSRCDCVDECEVCGHLGLIDTAHDWDDYGPRGRCRRCGDQWNLWHSAEA
jgi:hypothetical protein